MWILVYRAPRPAQLTVKVGDTIGEISHTPRPYWEVWDCDNQGIPLTPKSYIPDGNSGNPARWYATDGNAAERAADAAYNNNVRQYPEMMEYTE